MGRKDEEKNKVGRPKLADDKLKKKSYIMLGVALLLTICLTFGGLFSLTSVRLGSLKGAVAEKPANPAFDDINFYKLVVDGYNGTKPNKISYKTKLTDEQLGTITTLWSSEYKINSTKGIEKLVNLKVVHIYGDKLTNMDLSKNKKLTSLSVSADNLNSINIKKNVNLTYLEIYGDKLKSLDTSQNTNLTNLRLDVFELSNIDISKNVKLTNLVLLDTELNSINLGKNKNLTNVEIGKFHEKNAKLKNIDLSNNVNLVSLKLGGNQLSNINISKNTNLTELWLNDNKLKTVDLSKNTNLNRLFLQENQLTNVNISKNIYLTELWLSNNKLKNVDLSKNINLNRLFLQENQLSNINISKNTNLTELWLNDNKLKTVDLSKNTNLNRLVIGGNQFENIDLSKNINLDDLDISESKLTGINLSKNINLTSLNISNNKLKTIDLNKNINLKYLNSSENKLTNIDLSKNINLTNLISNDNNFSTVRIIKDEKIKSSFIPNSYFIKKIDSDVATYSNGYLNGVKTGSKKVYNTTLYYNKYFLYIKVFDLASDKYKIDKQNKYVYVEDDTDKEVLNNIKVSSNANKKIEKGYFYVMDKEDKVVVEKYKIVRVVSKNYKLLTSKDKTKKYIYTKSNGFNKNNIKLENCTLQQNGKESITIKYGNTVLGEYRILNVCNALLAKNGSYKVSCEEDDAKINRVYQYISDEEKTLSAKEGKISVEESNSDRGAVVKVDYTYKGKKYTDESNLITIPRSASFKHETEETYCKVYITGVNTSKALYSVRCDANAKPSKIEVYEGDTKIALLDKNYKEHYGLFEDNRSIEFSKYKMQNGKTYTIRIAYNFVDNGKIKYDYYRTSFKIGENKKESIPSIAQDDTQKCAIKIIKVSKGSLKYSLACNKNARPNSIRITTKYNNRPLSKISKKVIVNHTSTYLNGKTQNLKEELSVINNFGTKAQNVGALSYGMKEEGVITNLDKGEYRLLFYYAIKDNAGKVITNYVRTYSNAMNVN